MSRIVVFHKIGGPEVLQIENKDVPPPKEGEVQIKVKALGLNRAESMFRSGQYLEEPKLPSRIGYEASGIVEAVGPGVKGFAKGDIVSVIPSFSQGDYGVYGEVATVPVHSVVKHPTFLSFEEAAAVWMQYTTAYGALIDIAKIKKGDFVVIPAASSSVGLAAIELCNLNGATPIATTRKKSKKEALQKAGAKHVIVTEEENLVEQIHEITKGKGARVVFDPVGGKAVLELAKGMAFGGILFQYGALSPDPTPFPLFEAMSKSLNNGGGDPGAGPESPPGRPQTVLAASDRQADARGRVQVPPVSRAVDPPRAPTWTAWVAADRAYYDRVWAADALAGEMVSFPGNYPGRQFPLSGTDSSLAGAARPGISTGDRPHRAARRPAHGHRGVARARAPASGLGRHVVGRRPAHLQWHSGERPGHPLWGDDPAARWGPHQPRDVDRDNDH